MKQRFVEAEPFRRILQSASGNRFQAGAPTRSTSQSRNGKTSRTYPLSAQEVSNEKCFNRFQARFVVDIDLSNAVLVYCLLIINGKFLPTKQCRATQ